MSVNIKIGRKDCFFVQLSYSFSHTNIRSLLSCWVFAEQFLHAKQCNIVLPHQWFDKVAAAQADASSAAATTRKVKADKVEEYIYMKMEILSKYLNFPFFVFRFENLQKFHIFEMFITSNGNNNRMLYRKIYFTMAFCRLMILFFYDSSNSLCLRNQIENIQNKTVKWVDELKKKSKKNRKRNKSAYNFMCCVCANFIWWYSINSHRINAHSCKTFLLTQTHRHIVFDLHCLSFSKQINSSHRIQSFWWCKCEKSRHILCIHEYIFFFHYDTVLFFYYGIALTIE